MAPCSTPQTPSKGTELSTLADQTPCWPLSSAWQGRTAFASCPWRRGWGVETARATGAWFLCAEAATQGPASKDPSSLLRSWRGSPRAENQCRPRGRALRAPASEPPDPRFRNTLQRSPRRGGRRVRGDAAQDDYPGRKSRQSTTPRRRNPGRDDQLHRPPEPWRRGLLAGSPRV